MLLARAPPPPSLPSAASSPLRRESMIRPRCVPSLRASVATAAAAKAAPLRGGQNHKQVASLANPLVKHCVKLRLSAAYRRSCRRILLVGLAPILEMCRFELSAIENFLLLDGVELPDELCEFSGNVVYSDAVLDGLFRSAKRILVLDGIQDPGNLGTLIRSACAFKWDGVFLLPACCDPFNEKALRAARGASLQLPVVSVLGSEGSGLSAETLQACELVNIPMEAGM
ncbi:hypothetical protein GUJ93_ZPchr0656g26851 [Zizania palustris]|uniref:tRNA/rRNA methyltransferase SpoU type domain-containing protein n=1 Tax=Zizania palustris TaxID=103762 RepID=A0A8J5R6W3_ZIZPA|nr:hypothetical protein GUJ93_ZPchr0656g26851 [Zizania palustris]